MRALVFILLLSGCSWMAPRIGVCPSPQSLDVGGWEPIFCSIEDGKLEDVWCVFEGVRDGKVCRVIAETIGCGDWQIGPCWSGKVNLSEKIL